MEIWVDSPALPSIPSTVSKPPLSPPPSPEDQLNSVLTPLPILETEDLEVLNLPPSLLPPPVSPVKLVSNSPDPPSPHAVLPPPLDGEMLPWGWTILVLSQFLPHP